MPLSFLFTSPRRPRFPLNPRNSKALIITNARFHHYRHYLPRLWRRSVVRASFKQGVHHRYVTAPLPLYCILESDLPRRTGFRPNGDPPRARLGGGRSTYRQAPRPPNRQAHRPPPNQQAGQSRPLSRIPEEPKVKYTPGKDTVSNYPAQGNYELRMDEFLRRMPSRQAQPSKTSQERLPSPPPPTRSLSLPPPTVRNNLNPPAQRQSTPYRQAKTKTEERSDDGMPPPPEPEMRYTADRRTNFPAHQLPKIDARGFFARHGVNPRYKFKP
ncbi:hypothetical protein F5148DRAFT_1178571 [Russula earlei]|uniref:Uncharacterized protein n=1 Tax=Russula earlei TaxID=71964 RepID=A0ACC0UH13_9AGAM|nr:hypothetical protein F5148DRAFT_1178571 [Russula earlei]